MKINNYWQNKLNKQSKIFPKLAFALTNQAEYFTKLGIDSDISYKKYLTTMKKMAYPRGNEISTIDTPRNLNKWMQALQQIYTLGYQPGQDLNSALEIVIQSWDIMEKKDFRNWMNFYTEGAHEKYKLAFLDNLKTTLPKPAIPDISSYQVHDPEYQETIKKQEISRKIKAIISRLNAAERLATDPEVQKELQKKLDIGILKWLEELQRVKRMVQVAPMRHASSSLLEDLIIKEANVLKRKGFPKAALEMSKLAQDASAQVVQPIEPPVSPPQTDDGEEAMKEFVKGLNLQQDDVTDVQDMEDDPLSSITVIAQEIPVEDLSQPPEVQAPELNNSVDLEISEPELEPQPPVPDPVAQQSNNLLDAALNTVTIPDIIADLEAMANILRTREMSRQLAIIDIKMDKLNISSFFPQLAEASSKILDATQYSLTRIEEVSSKLRGAVETPKAKELQLSSPIAPVPVKPIPEIKPEVLRQNLDQQTQEEKARKEKRRQDQVASEMEQITKPEAPVPVELTQPVNLPAPIK